MFSFLDAGKSRHEEDYALAQFPYFSVDELKLVVGMGHIKSSIQQDGSEVLMSTRGLRLALHSVLLLALITQLLASGSVEPRYRDSFQQPHIGPRFIFLIVLFEKTLAER